MFYNFIIFVVHMVTKLIFNIKFEGIENIPTNKGFILASNHRTNYDPIFAVIKLPVQMNFMAKEELFKNKFFGWFVSKVNAFPISRGKGDGEGISRALEVLEEGKPLMMFPEGTRSKTGKPGRPRSGIAFISAKAGVGILPMTIDYGDKLRFRAKVTIKYHPMLTQHDLNIDINAPRTVRAAAKKVMDSIISGLSYWPTEEAEA